MTNITYWHPWPTNITGIGSWLAWANNVVGNQLGNLIVGTTFIIAFIILSIMGKDSKALGPSAFIALVIAIWFARLSIIHPLVIIGLIIMTILGFLWAASDKSI